MAVYIVSVTLSDTLSFDTTLQLGLALQWLRSVVNVGVVSILEPHRTLLVER